MSKFDTNIRESVDWFNSEAEVIEGEELIKQRELMRQQRKRLREIENGAFDHKPN